MDSTLLDHTTFKSPKEQTYFYLIHDKVSRRIGPLSQPEYILAQYQQKRNQTSFKFGLED